MKALLQRVIKSSVNINGEIFSNIDNGLLVLIGIHKSDEIKDIKYIVYKCINLRIFSDKNDKFNYSALDMKSELLVVSQFTLYADVSKGRRPRFFESESPLEEEKIYNETIEEFNKTGLNIKTGEFGAKMEINLVNDGPVTILLDSKL